MLKRCFVVALATSALVASSPALAQQPPSKYPMLDSIAEKVVHKYQTSSCVQLATEKSQPATGEKAAMEQRAIELLKSDAEVRKAFLARVAAPIADKLLQCGMIP